MVLPLVGEYTNSIKDNPGGLLATGITSYQRFRDRVDSNPCPRVRVAGWLAGAPCQHTSPFIFQ